jgi:branched-chain amino acid transport system permease protein
MGFTAGIKGFTAAVFGGLGKLEGALLGGFVLAFLEIITIISFDNSSGYKDAIAFLILIFTLTFLPTGILSSKIVTRS